jgi:glutamine synthetase
VTLDAGRGLDRLRHRRLLNDGPFELRAEVEAGSVDTVIAAFTDMQGEPAFADGSEVFRQYLAGQIACASELALFLAPTINSYKRFAAGSWAPTTLAWGYDNRTCGFRIVGDGASLRAETRIPGADANPYLTYARTEQRLFDEAVTCYERERMFERG